MKVFAALLATSIFASSPHPVRDEIVDTVKRETTSWQPQEVNHNYLRHISPQALQSRFGNLGTSLNPFDQFGKDFKTGTEKLFSYVQSALGLKQEAFIYKKLQQSLAEIEEIPSDLPRFWSWREQRPECMGPIENQGDCGACWAFSSAGLLADRFCIHSDGAIKTRLSPQEMVDCNFENFGCVGGYLTNTIDYLQTEGAVPSDCIAYKEDLGLCSYRCDNGESTGKDRYYCKLGSMVIATTHKEIMTELYRNGPMMVGLMIYEDFMNYGSGIYKHITGEEMGGHAMKLLGYGHDEKEGLYWELQNQWTEEWGEKGYVRVRAGEIGIDSVAVSCMPDLI